MLEPRFVDRGDRHVVLTGPVTGMVLKRLEGFPQVISMARRDLEEETELARGADADPRPGRL